MFHFHDKTRRKLAIAGFILLCILPTCAIAGWCLWRNVPWETQLAAEQLQLQLGWKVKLSQLKHPRPGADVYENIELLDPETGHSIFACKSVEVSHRQIGQEKPTLVFAFDRPEIDADAIPQIHRLIERVLQDQVTPGANSLFSAAELTLRRGKSIRTYPDIVAGVEHATGYVQAALQFRLPDAQAKMPVTLRLYRDRTTTPPKNHFELVAAENEVPKEMIALMGGDEKE
jgi:hypothetical protein